MRNLKIKKEKGITLIALVVTILVLLILAAVGINTLLGEEGIITRAKESKDDYRAESVKEQISMWKTDKDLTKYTGGELTQGKEEFLLGLVDQELLTEKEKTELLENGVTTIGKKQVYFITSKTLVEMYKAAQEAGCEGEESCTTPEEHLHIGDYVNYENPNSGTVTISGVEAGIKDAATDRGETIEDESTLNQTYTLINSKENPETNKNNVNWRVLGLDEETGGIKLISEIPLRQDVGLRDEGILWLCGAKGYLNSVTEIKEETGETKIGILDTICSMYANSKYGNVKARSVTVEDLNELTGVKTTEDIRTYDISQEMAFRNSLEYGETYELSGQITPELMESIRNGEITMTEEELSATISTGIIDGYFYSVNTSVRDLPSKTISLKKEELIFPGISYWLASRGVMAMEYDTEYALNVWSLGLAGNMLFDNSGVTTGKDIGNCNVPIYFADGQDMAALSLSAVRPVICLDSKITVDDIQKIEEPEEKIWGWKE